MNVILSVMCVCLLRAGWRRPAIAVRLACVGRSDRRLFNDFRQFKVENLVPPTVTKERLQDGRRFSPLTVRHSRDAASDIVTRWRFALDPVMHQEQQVCAMLHRGEMSGAGQIIGNVERHPMPLHGLDYRPTVLLAIQAISSDC